MNFIEQYLTESDDALQEDFNQGFFDSIDDESIQQHEYNLLYKKIVEQGLFDDLSDFYWSLESKQSNQWKNLSSDLLDYSNNLIFKLFKLKKDDQHHDLFNIMKCSKKLIFELFKLQKHDKSYGLLKEDDSLDVANILWYEHLLWVILNDDMVDLHIENAQFYASDSYHYNRHIQQKINNIKELKLMILSMITNDDTTINDDIYNSLIDISKILENIGLKHKKKIKSKEDDHLWNKYVFNLEWLKKALEVLIENRTNKDFNANQTSINLYDFTDDKLINFLQYMIDTCINFLSLEKKLQDIDKIDNFNTITLNKVTQYIDVAYDEHTLDVLWTLLIAFKWILPSIIWTNYTSIVLMHLNVRKKNLSIYWIIRHHLNHIYKCYLNHKILKHDHDNKMIYSYHNISSILKFIDYFTHDLDPITMHAIKLAINQMYHITKNYIINSNYTNHLTDDLTYSVGIFDEKDYILFDDNEHNINAKYSMHYDSKKGIYRFSIIFNFTNILSWLMHLKSNDKNIFQMIWNPNFMIDIRRYSIEQLYQLYEDRITSKCNIKEYLNQALNSKNIVHIDNNLDKLDLRIKQSFEACIIKPIINSLDKRGYKNHTIVKILKSYLIEDAWTLSSNISCKRSNHLIFKEAIKDTKKNNTYDDHFWSQLFPLMLSIDGFIKGQQDDNDAINTIRTFKNYLIDPVNTQTSCKITLLKHKDLLKILSKDDVCQHWFLYTFLNVDQDKALRRQYISSIIDWFKDRLTAKLIDLSPSIKFIHYIKLLTNVPNDEWKYILLKRCFDELSLGFFTILDKKNDIYREFNDLNKLLSTQKLKRSNIPKNIQYAIKDVVSMIPKRIRYDMYCLLHNVKLYFNHSVNHSQAPVKLIIQHNNKYKVKRCTFTETEFTIDDDIRTFIKDHNVVYLIDLLQDILYVDVSVDHLPFINDSMTYTSSIKWFLIHFILRRKIIKTLDKFHVKKNSPMFYRLCTNDHLQQYMIKMIIGEDIVQDFQTCHYYLNAFSTLTNTCLAIKSSYWLWYEYLMKKIYEQNVDKIMGNPSIKKIISIIENDVDFKSIKIIWNFESFKSFIDKNNLKNIKLQDKNNLYALIIGLLIKNRDIVVWKNILKDLLGTNALLENRTIYKEVYLRNKVILNDRINELWNIIYSSYKSNHSKKILKDYVRQSYSNLVWGINERINESINYWYHVHRPHDLPYHQYDLQLSLEWFKDIDKNVTLMMNTLYDDPDIKWWFYLNDSKVYLSRQWLKLYHDYPFIFDLFFKRNFFSYLN